MKLFGKFREHQFDKKKDDKDIINQEPKSSKSNITK